MGFLHAGHESLIEKARSENDRVAVSIFVNPTQFGPSEDLDKYPRNWERDREICQSHGVSLVFAPTPGEMYPEGFATKVGVTGMAKVLCGRSRPIHFDGVCLICAKLFNIVKPHRAYFGLKDSQQYFILSRMVKDLNLDIELKPCPIVREADGLALSSRNAYLNRAERRAATVLNRALTAAKEAAIGGQRSASELVRLIEEVVAREPLARLEYARVVATSDLREVTLIGQGTSGQGTAGQAPEGQGASGQGPEGQGTSGQGPEGEAASAVLVAASVWIGGTRLIDNFIREI
jgi:pantoate--beta-alanine ligase